MAGMGADLLATEPVFAATIAVIEPIIARESGFSDRGDDRRREGHRNRPSPTHDFRDAGRDGRDVEVLRRAAGRGHRPLAGESAAAVVAGALTLEDGLKVICRRSKLMKRISGSGAMAAVELPGPQVLSELSVRGIKNVVLAVAASPDVHRHRR